MSRSTIFGRIGQLFRRKPRYDQDELPLMRELNHLPADSPSAPVSSAAEAAPRAMTTLPPTPPSAPLSPLPILPDMQPLSEPSAVARRSFLRPWSAWGRRETPDGAGIQNGVQALSGLMGSIRENLEKQGRRQDELLAHLSHLPRVLEMIPNNNRVQTDTLQAIHQQLENQNLQQRQLSTILEKVTLAGRDQRANLEALRDRVELLSLHDEGIAENLRSVSAAMQTVTRNSNTGTQVLEQLRDNLRTRDSQLEKVLRAQGNRYLMVMTVALVVAFAALVSMFIFGIIILCYLK